MDARHGGSVKFIHRRKDANEITQHQIGIVIDRNIALTHNTFHNPYSYIRTNQKPIQMENFVWIRNGKTHEASMSAVARNVNQYLSHAIQSS